MTDAAAQASASGSLDPKRSFQGLILTLHNYWAAYGAVVLQPYDMEVGAGTFHPATTLRSIGPRPWKAAYVQPSRRPGDGRYGENPNRLQHYYQYQVLLKPSPPDLQDLYLGSLSAIGIDPKNHDIRFVEDDWESPTLGAWGLGWEVWCDGMEVSQFTYFQQVGGIDCHPGLRRADLWPGAPRHVCARASTMSTTSTSTAAKARPKSPMARSSCRLSRSIPAYNFEHANTEALLRHFEDAEAECAALLESRRNQPGPSSDGSCRPMTSASRPATFSICSMPAGSSP